MVSSTTVAAVLDGELELTRDAGQTWTTESLPPGAVPDAVDFVNARTGWVLVWTGTSLGHQAIYRTVDGGMHWQLQVSTPLTYYGGALDMTSAQDGWAIASTTLYRTTDGGVHWTAVPLPAGNVPTAVSFSSGTQGWVATRESAGPAPGWVWATTDGRHFRRILTSADGVGAITRNPNGSGDVVEGASGATLEFGPVVQTTNDGRSWSTLTTVAALMNSQAYGYAAGVTFRGQTGWIGTNNGALGFEPTGLVVTSNRGHTWHVVNGHGGWAIQGVTLTAPGVGWLVASGSQGLDFLAHTNDNGVLWTITRPPATPTSLDFVSPGVGYGMGLPNHPSAIATTHNGGQSWSIDYNAPESFAVYAFSQSVGLGVVNTQRAGLATLQADVYQSSDAGHHWRLLSTVHAHVVMVAHVGKNTWVMEIQSAASHTHFELSTDDGRHWAPLTLTVARGDPVSVVSRHRVWVFVKPRKDSSGTQGRLVLETMAGVTQKIVLRLPTAGAIQDQVNAVDFRNTRDGWLSVTRIVRTVIHKPGIKKPVHALSLTKLLYDTADGGQHWTVWQLPSSWNVTAVDLVTAHMGYLIANGTVVKTTDGGGFWHLALH